MILSVDGLGGDVATVRVVPCPACPSQAEPHDHDGSNHQKCTTPKTMVLSPERHA